MKHEIPSGETEVLSRENTVSLDETSVSQAKRTDKPVPLSGDTVFHRIGARVVFFLQTKPVIF